MKCKCPFGLFFPDIFKQFVKSWSKNEKNLLRDYLRFKNFININENSTKTESCDVRLFLVILWIKKHGNDKEG